MADDAPDRGGSADAWWDRVARRVGRSEGDPARSAFVLAGGGSRGAVQVGMLKELVERGVRADRVYGASVGAVNAAAYCGDPTPAGVAHLERVWRSLSGDLVFPRRRGHGPWTYFQQRSAVHPNTGLRRIVEDGLRFERLEDAEVPLEVVATSLDDGRERWLCQGPAVEAILASAAIPAMFPPVTVGGELLIDGGVVDNVPIGRAIEGGARTVYVLLASPLHFRPRPARRPAEAVLTAFFVAVHARFARELAALPPGVEVVVFSGCSDPAADYRDFSATSELIEAGRTEVARVLDGGSTDRRPPAPGPATTRAHQPAGRTHQPADRTHQPADRTRPPPGLGPGAASHGASSPVAPSSERARADRLSRPAGGMGAR